MKVVFREWWKDKIACFLMLLYFIVEVSYTIIDTRIISMIANVLADPRNVRNNLIILAATSAILVALYMAQSYILPIAKLHCFTEINNRHVDKLLDSDFEMFTKFSCSRIWTAGGFMWSITNIGTYIIRMILNVVSITITLYAMYIVGGSTVYPIIAVYAVAVIVFKILFKKLNTIDKKNKEILKERNQEAENIVNGFAEVRSFNTIEEHRSSLHGLNKKIFYWKNKKNKINTMLHGSIEIVEKSGMMIAIIYSIKLLSEGLLTQAAAMSLVLYVMRLLNPLLGILDFTDMLSEELALSDDYEKIAEYVNKNSEDGSMTLNSFENEIRLDNVSFAYDDSSMALKNINMTIKKGQKIGICGISGAGKSTLFKLINRFYVPTSGKITIDGFDINDITKDSYYRFIGSVHQENIIFPGTILQNVMYGTKVAFHGAFKEACRKANIYEFINSLPDKYETTVGPRGLKLSGGQKQRIALARLFMRDPCIILLDEATSSLDNESETFIQDAIDGLQGKTVITIAHRLSTIKNCDVIYVLGRDGVIESGTHDELVKLGGAYAKMLK